MTQGFPLPIIRNETPNLPCPKRLETRMYVWCAWWDKDPLVLSIFPYGVVPLSPARLEGWALPRKRSGRFVWFQNLKGRYIHPLKRRCTLKMGRNPNGKDRIPTIHFQVRTVSFRAGIHHWKRTCPQEIHLPTIDFRGHPFVFRGVNGIWEMWMYDLNGWVYLDVY